jgi:hypothetical protein
MDNTADAWMQDFDALDQKEIRWAQLYDSDEFRHRTTGANDLRLISRLAAKLRHYEALLNDHAIPLDLTPGAEDHA